MSENRVVKIIIDDGSLEKALDRDKKLVEKLDRQLANLKEGTKQWNDVTKDRENILKRIQQTEDQMAGKLGPSINQLKARQRELNRELNQMPIELRKSSAAAMELKKVDAELAKVRNEARATGGVLANLKTRIGTLADGFNKYLGMAGAGIAAVTGLAMGFMNQVRRAGELSDAHADVAKTTGLTTKEVKDLDRELRKIDTRTPRQELLKLASQAGKLGINSKKDVLEFVEAADKINVALGEDLGADAIVNLGKINELMGTNAQYGYGEAMLKTGSAINALGANSMAAEGFLVQMAKRIGGVGAQSKMSIPEILGLSSTVDNLGMQAEMSGTAIQNVLIDMFQDTPKFAKMAGMSLQDFSDLMNKDVNEAFLRVLEGLKGNNSGMTELTANVSKLGIDGARGASVIMALAGKTDFLRQQQALANDEYNKGTSILDEFNTKNENAAAKLEKFGKKISASLSLMITPEMVSNMIDFTSRLLGFSTAAEQASNSMKKQSAEVSRLDRDSLPLIERYEVLKEKTELSVYEQEEMSIILKQLRETIPFTAFEFDEYGNAIGLSTQKSKEFIEQQKEILKVKTQKAFEENKEAAIEYANELEELNRKAAMLGSGRKVNVGLKFFDPNDIEDMKKFEVMLNDQKAKVKMALTEIESTGREVLGSTEKVTNTTWMGFTTGATRTLGEIATMVNYVSDETNKSTGKAGEGIVDLNKLTSTELQKIANDATNQNAEAAKKILEARMKFEQEANEKTEKEREKEAEKRRADIEKFVADLGRLNQEVANMGVEGLERDVQVIEQKYAKLFEEAKRLAQNTTELEKLKEKELAIIGEKYRKEREVKEKELSQELENIRLNATNRGIEKELVALDRKFDEMVKKAGTNQELIAEIEAARIEEKGRLELEHEQRIQAELLTSRKKTKDDELKAINKHYEDLLKKAGDNQELQKAIEFARIDAVDAWEKQKKGELSDFAITQGEAALNAIGQIMANNRRSEFEEANLELRQKQDNDTRALDEWYAKEMAVKGKSEAGKAIVEQQFREKKDALNKDYAEREKQLKLEQWQADKRAALGQAVIAGALAVVKALPNPFTATAAGIAAGLQIGIIAAEKPPKFEKGGVANGASHARGGIAMIDSSSGRKVGEMEGGEPYLILSRNTYSNNRDVINSLLDSSLNRNGAPIRYPRFGRQPNVNWGKVAAAAMVPHYALGGITPAKASSSNTSSSSEAESRQDVLMAGVMELLQLNATAISELRSQLQRPVKAITVIGNNEAEEVQEVFSENSFIDGGAEF